jgi:hypothetical protein
MLLPRHRVSRRLAVAWLVICGTTLALMLARLALHADDRGSLASLVPLYWLSLPLGHAGMLAFIKVRTALYLSGAAPGLVIEGLMQWITLAILGYAQWFLLLPFLARKCQLALQFLFNRDAVKRGPAS